MSRRVARCHRRPLRSGPSATAYSGGVTTAATALPITLIVGDDRAAVERRFRQWLAHASPGAMLVNARPAMEWPFSTPLVDHLPAGPVVVTAPDAHAAAMRRAVHETGGHATLMRAPDDLRRLVSVFQPEAGPLAALSERVRAGFDPLGILNPGRMG